MKKNFIKNKKGINFTLNERPRGHNIMKGTRNHWPKFKSKKNLDISFCKKISVKLTTLYNYENRSVYNMLSSFCKEIPL